MKGTSSFLFSLTESSRQVRGAGKAESEYIPELCTERLLHTDRPSRLQRATPVIVSEYIRRANERKRETDISHKTPSGGVLGKAACVSSL